MTNKGQAKTQPTQSEGRAYIRKGFQIINEDYDATIQECYISQQFKQYCTKKFKWKGNTYNTVLWKAFTHEAKKLNVNWRTNLLKYVYEWLPMGNTLKIIDPYAKTNCPSCDTLVESPLHLFCCPAEGQYDITVLCVEAITEINCKWKLNDILAHEISNSLYNWTKSPSTRPTFENVEDIMIQTIIGISIEHWMGQLPERLCINSIPRFNQYKT
jgi:hypothetical protein